MAARTRKPKNVSPAPASAPVSPRASAKKAPAKKAASKKAPAKKAAAAKPATTRKVTGKKAPTKKAPAKKAPAKKAPAKKAPAKKAPAKKAPAKKAPAKKAPAKKAPAKKAPAKKAPSRVARPVRIFAGASDVRILVVDDEPEVLALLVPFLESKGYSVSEASDGDQALEKILTERPNIVVLDVMMPGLSGWEISRYVRERAELDPVRIIMATGIGHETNAATSPLYGADAYLDKPFRLDALERTVEGVILRIEQGAYEAPIIA